MKNLTILLVASMIVGCNQLPQDIFVLTPELLAQRPIETRRYDGITEEKLIIASSNALQDLGFGLENSEVKLGVLTASKKRDASSGWQVAGAIFLALLGGKSQPRDVEQTIRASLVVRPAIDSSGNAMSSSEFVRVSFQRVVKRSDNSIYVETLRDEELFKGFFDHVSKSVFLEAQKI